MRLVVYADLQDHIAHIYVYLLHYVLASCNQILVHQISTGASQKLNYTLSQGHRDKCPTVLACSGSPAIAPLLYSCMKAACREVATSRGAQAAWQSLADLHEPRTQPRVMTAKRTQRRLKGNCYHTVATTSGLMRPQAWSVRHMVRARVHRCLAKLMRAHAVRAKGKQHEPFCAAKYSKHSAFELLTD